MPELPDVHLIKKWLQQILVQESRQASRIEYILTDDASLLKMNQDFLQHDTLTDIITFPYSSNPIAGEIFISVDRVRENALQYHVPATVEALRVMAHGVLHLCGWNDKTNEESVLMRKRENACLALFGIHVSGNEFSSS